jgi:NitT/TauT family transport system ATP-binding protein
VAILGPSGCGKSTILGILSGLLAQDGGIARIPPAHEIAYVFQTARLLPWRTIEQNLDITRAARLRQRGRPYQRSTADYLKAAGLWEYRAFYPAALSGGMQQRASIARALSVEPTMLLMDEPFSALDVQTRQLMENELLELWSADRKSVLFITHDLEEAIALSDRVIVLSAGPGTHPIGEFIIDLPRPRDVNEIRMTPRFVEIHGDIWHAMKDEVLKGYAQSRKSQ